MLHQTPPYLIWRKISVNFYNDNACNRDHAYMIIKSLLNWEPENSTKTLKPGFAKYAVDTNLFRLGSTNPKKNSQCLDAFSYNL